MINNKYYIRDNRVINLAKTESIYVGHSVGGLCIIAQGAKEHVLIKLETPKWSKVKEKLNISLKAQANVSLKIIIESDKEFITEDDVLEELIERFTKVREEKKNKKNNNKSKISSTRKGRSKKRKEENG